MRNRLLTTLDYIDVPSHAAEASIIHRYEHPAVAQERRLLSRSPVVDLRHKIRLCHFSRTSPVAKCDL